MISYTGDVREQLQSQSLLRCRRKLFSPRRMNHAGNAWRDARNHVKIKFHVVAARNTLHLLISDNHNASIRRVVTVFPPPPAFVPS